MVVHAAEECEYRETCLKFWSGHSATGKRGSPRVAHRSLKQLQMRTRCVVFRPVVGLQLTGQELIDPADGNVNRALKQVVHFVFHLAHCLSCRLLHFPPDCDIRGCQWNEHCVDAGEQEVHDRDCSTEVLKIGEIRLVFGVFLRNCGVIRSGHG
jgi:hypothetical protein